MTTRKKFGLVLLVLVSAFAFWMASGIYARIPKTPAAAVKKFYEQAAAEDQLMDPLILAGPGVVPLLAEDLMNPRMPRRRYAIGALGNIQDKSAIVILEKLTRSRSEEDYIRCDAISAIGMLDGQAIQRMASELEPEAQSQCLTEIAREMGGDYDQWLKANPLRRTYLDALLGWHD